jgi:hypothetical protein
MRPLFSLIALLWTVPASAHPGHLAGLAGHDHWVAGAAIGLAVVIGLLGILKGQNDENEEAVDEEETEATEAGA